MKGGRGLDSPPYQPALPVIILSCELKRVESRGAPAALEYRHHCLDEQQLLVGLGFLKKDLKKP